ncbi:unnamed protein product [Porites lobata]|uniref:GB1/RHD3-type G domain-containing protein n=1 Tax=Porites lobata TaxID=104759 RepID=A0ABN8QIS5_9CNID|nr:unnamed protein product [Porites lobata]
MKLTTSQSLPLSSASSVMIMSHSIDLAGDARPVCVVSIAGPYRKGKSYVLSEVFSQPEVFPLGHHLRPETLGIWLWIVPEVFKDSTGQEFKVLLLDSEGIDSVTCEGYDDTQIFTLTVLLASVLIYNSQGVPTRTDLEGLKYIVKLSQSIEVRSKAEAGKSPEDSKFFYKTFPFFLWLLRDVAQDLPPDCNSIKDYFLKEVFKVPDSSSAETQDRQKVAESILGYFAGFEAFSLPPPTADKELLKNIKDNKSQMDPFFQELDQFKSLLKSTLTPKKSFNESELVTGEGLAAIVQSYVEAINGPGIIPNIQNAWETFVEKKCSEAITAAVKKYEEVMKSNLREERPCDNDELRKFHGTALDKGKGCFMTETVGFSTNSTEKHLNKLKKLLYAKLTSWETRNEKLTREFCNSLLRQLKEKHLDPVLQRLQGKEAAKISFDEVIGGYNHMQDDYKNSAIGAKDVIAAVWAEFHPALLKEKEQSLNWLGQLKDYDEKLAQELAAKALQEQKNQKLEEEQKKLVQMSQEMKKEMEMLRRKQKEETQKVHEQLENERTLQQEQMKNMMEANMKSAKRERELLEQKNQDHIESLKRQYEAKEARHAKEMKDMQENLNSFKKELAKFKEPGFFEYYYSGSKEWADKNCLIM